MSQIAHIFPAFVIKFLNTEVEILERNGINFSDYLNSIENACQIHLTDFHITENNYIDNELKSQLLSYAFSVAFSDILRKDGVKPQMISGFSMGIYAACYHSGVIDFLTGAKLIRDIYQTLYNELPAPCAMLAVIGFNRLDLTKIVENYNFEIVIKNGDHSFVIAGINNDTDRLITHLTTEGAIHIQPFSVKVPYHSTFILPLKNRITNIVDTLQFTAEPLYPYISMIDQKIISDSSGLKHELVRNLFCHLDLKATLRALDHHNLSCILECGPGNSLYKSAKFIDTQCRLLTIKKLDTFLQ